MAALTIEAMQVSDLDAVLAIEKLCFPMPWSRFAFQTELTQNHYALYIVGKIGGQIVAYAGAWIILDEAHITNVAVHPDFGRYCWPFWLELKLEGLLGLH